MTAPKISKPFGDFHEQACLCHSWFREQARAALPHLSLTHLPPGSSELADQVFLRCSGWQNQPLKAFLAPSCTRSPNIQSAKASHVSEPKVKDQEDTHALGWEEWPSPQSEGPRSRQGWRTTWYNSGYSIHVCWMNEQIIKLHVCWMNEHIIK